MPPTSTFAATLIEWHAHHGRHQLPWQNSTDPYRVWLSEIMLQQTQVDTVVPYYDRFLARFPDVASLAAADMDMVLGLWSGLGYYARARNLHQAARVIMSEFAGAFPADAQAIMGLPGVGRSTAAAIAAFAFGERGAILDGNVKRVLCRVFGVEGFPGDKAVEARLWLLAESLLPPTDIAIYTQAQMDFGATLCTRSRPHCELCPMLRDCVAHRCDRVAQLPAPRPRRSNPQRTVTALVVLAGDRVLLEKRPPAGIWGGLLSLPELALDQDPAAWLQTHIGASPPAPVALAPVRHAFTHFKLEMRPLLFEAVCPSVAAEAGFEWLPLDRLDAAPLPTPARRILESLARPNA